jgi:hypothetical protein
MASKPARRGRGEPKEQVTAKVTLRLSLEVAQRLGVESAMRRVSQSAIVEQVLGDYLRRWRLPSTVEETAPKGNPRADHTEDAA